MRITDGMRQTSTRAAQSAASERLHQATRQAVTGKRVEAPADDPASFARITRTGGNLARWEGRAQSLSQAEGDAQIGEAALASASDVMVRLREISVQMADGTASAADRALAAKEVTALRQQLVDIGNTRGSTGYLFGGTRTDAPPFDNAGVFAGNDIAISVETSDGVSVRKNASGATAFTAAGGRDILADAAALSTALATDNVAGIQSSIDAMGEGHKQLVRARGETGLQLDRMKIAQEVAAGATLALSAAQAKDAEVDLTEAFSGLSDAQQAYERAIEISRRTLAMFDIKNM